MGEKLLDIGLSKDFFGFDTQRHKQQKQNKQERLQQASAQQKKQ